MMYLSRKSFIYNIRHLNSLRRKDINGIWRVRYDSNDIAVKSKAVFSKLLKEIFK